MTLRGKLMVLFGGLAGIALLTSAVALFVTLRWQATTGEMEQHYLRSLLLENVRAETFGALKEVDDALTGDAVDAADDFERLIAPSASTFAEWSRLADTPAEQAEVESIKNAYDRLTGSARRVFALLGKGERDEAVRVMDDELDTGDYAAFRELTEKAVSADLQRRREIGLETQNVRRTAQVMIAGALLGTLSLVFLLAAFLSQDLFRPLRDMRDGLTALAQGNFAHRLPADGDDELGDAGRAYNRAVEQIVRRERAGGDSHGASDDWRDTPARLTLHRIAARLQETLARLVAEGGGPAAAKAAEEADALARAAGRMAAIGFPLDLDLGPVDLRELAHDAASRFRDDFIRRGIAFEIAADPGAAPISADRLKLSGAVDEVMRNALGALPDTGGRIGLRVLSAQELGEVRLEVADDGKGMDDALIARVLSFDPFDGANGAHGGLSLCRAVAMAHGGSLDVFSQPGKGSVVRFSLPTGH